MKKEKKAGNRTQVRIQEFGRKLHPDVLRSRFKSCRKFLVTVFTNRKTPTRQQEHEVSGSDRAGARTPPLEEECNNLLARQNSSSGSSSKRTGITVGLGNNEIKNTKKISIESAIINGDISDAEHVNGITTNEHEMNVSVPNLIVQKEDSVNSARCGGDSQLCSEIQQQNDLNPDTKVQLVINVGPRNKSPVTVQEWVDSLPITANYNSREECDTSGTSLGPTTDMESDTLTLGAEAGHLCDGRKPPVVTPVNVTITRCHVPSEAESHCSSVDSLLEARKPDPEEILLGLGFGGSAPSSYVETGRVPKRFLRPSQLKGVELEDFIRQQQDLIYTFESGSFGYRGLAGPSHTNPSQIVAKILERLREHERETTSMSSYHPDFKKRCFAQQSVTENPSRKFSKIARNVLTKIRCTPSTGSVLSPDNRRWLDSQGDKSPEVARRLILGQQSFTFGRDGDLIETFDMRRNAEKDAMEETDSNSNCQDVEENIDPEVETISERLKQNGGGEDVNHQTGSSTDLSLESMILQQAHSGPTERGEDNTSLALTSDELNNNSASSNIVSSIDSLSISSSECDSGNRSRGHLSLRDELNNSVDVNQNPVKRTKNVLTRYSSFEESVKENSDDECAAKAKLLNECRSCSERLDECTDSATGNEVASYTDKALLNKNLQKQYEELILLESKLEGLERPTPLVSKEQFISLTAEQRASLQSKVIRDALEVYQNQLKEDEMTDEWRNCLTTEARKVSDLLDDSSDSSKLSIIVYQMTLLLQQQSLLSSQIRGLSFPSSCHEMCDHILKRVHELELLVKQNENQLVGKK